jgi:HlyD family secretion protein
VVIAVRTGLDDDSFTEITGGELKPGDEVITGEQNGGSATPSRSISLRLG